MTANQSAKRLPYFLALIVGLALTSFTVATPLAAAEGALTLISAVKSGKVEFVQQALAENMSVDTTEPDGATALHWAAFRDYLEIADLLIAAGADVNASNALGATPLWLAADNGSAAMVDRLLTAGASPNAPLPGGETPLMTASRTGATAAVNSLLSARARVNEAEHSRGQTALMWAAAQGHHKVVEALLLHGADFSARSKIRPRLMHAASTNASQYDQGIIWNRGGFTSLLFTARHGHIPSAHLLLSAGASIDKPAPTGASPLVVATHSGQSQFAAYLLETGADPNSMGAGYSPLHAAILRGDGDLVKKLLAHGANPNARLKSGTPVRRASQDWAINPSLVSATPYWLAAYFHDVDIMRDLVSAGADPHLTTLERWQPVFDRAGGVGPPHIVGGFIPPLLAAVRGPAGRGRFFNTSLRNPDREELAVLAATRVAIGFGADVTAADLQGDTALHGAAQRNFSSVVSLLVEHGANLNVKNQSGRSPLDLAKAAEATRARVDDPSRYPQGNSADTLRAFGATESTKDPEETTSNR
tara:strand:- start:12465 stop:14063 length:1599 start_codon:yes stop_codon:yes gene_type:complete